MHRQPLDTVTVHPQVLRTLVRAAALEVEGVVRVGQASSHWLHFDLGDDSLRLIFEDEAVTVNLQVVVAAHSNLQAVCHKVQHAVERTLQKYVGIQVQAVNVHIADVVLRTVQP